VAGNPKGGAVINKTTPLPDNAEAVKVRTWSVGGEKYDVSNITHAERQFVEWFDKEPKEWQQRVTGVQVHINPYSPCGGCADVLSGWLKANPQVKHATLYWSKPYQGGASPTTRQALESMTKAGSGWLLYPGPEAVDNAPLGKKYCKKKE
jgi:hypothetical protein